MLKSYHKYSDVELVKMFRMDKKHAEAAFSELYHRYSSMVHAYCMRVLNQQQQAEDIFQDTFIKFYQNVDETRENTNIPGFLLKIARNQCLNYKRDKISTLPISEMDFLPDSENIYERKELLELVTMSLELLDFDHKEAFVLKEYNGLTYEELAGVCNITVVNAKSRVFRAKRKLKEILTPFFNEK